MRGNWIGGLRFEFRLLGQLLQKMQQLHLPKPCYNTRMNHARHHPPIDRLLGSIGRMLSSAALPATAERPYPADSDTADSDATLSPSEREMAGRYMRVNHVGEVCAQALYHSQSLTARDPALRTRMQQSAQEENDHLAWCEQRLDELGARQSLLNPLWQGGAFAIGTLAGIAGDKWSLGFVAETERQVVAHLGSHLDKLPAADARSRAVVVQMQLDEQQHADTAVQAGGAELPLPVKALMRAAARVMTTTAHWV